MLYKNVLGLIGNTPIVKLENISKLLHCEIFAKIEKNNYSGSIKDRASYFMLKDLLERKVIKKGGTIIEPTSGNTGISLAALSNYFDLKCIIVMPSSMSIERRKLIKAYNAELVLVDGGMLECQTKAKELNKSLPNSVIVGQFDNYQNVEAHYQCTGKEIINDLNDVDIVVMGIGTGGTISGVSKFLKENKTKIEIVGVEPENSPLLTKGEKGHHKIQGIGPNFVPSILNRTYIDEIVTVSDEEALIWAKEITRKEGLLVGLSSGASLCGAIKYIEKNNYKNKKIVIIFPDTGERYSWE